MKNFEAFKERGDVIWNIANLLRGPYRPPQYRRVMIPLTVLRRLDCVLEESKDKVVAEHKKLKAERKADGKAKYDAETIEKMINRKFKLTFHNTSDFTFRKLLGDPDKLAPNLVKFMSGFSTRARKIIEKFNFTDEIEKLEEANRLFEVVKQVAAVDLHPDTIPNIAMGYVFEDLVRRFNEQANEEAGDHFTPREVIKLMVSVLFTYDDLVYRESKVIKIYDPTVGTGGMLSESEKLIKDPETGLNPSANLELFGQEYNPEAYYEDTPTEPLTDAQHLYRLQHQIEETQLIHEEEVKAFCAVYFKPRRKETAYDQAQLSGILDQAVERFQERDEEERETVKTLLVNFRNMYGFLSQVIPYQDSDLEQLYTYLRFLLTKLPKRETGPGYHLEEEVELQYYRLQKISEGQIDLNTGDGKPLKGPSDVGTGQEDRDIKLSELIDILNERFGTDFTQADQLFFDQIQEEAIESETLKKAAAANSKDDFRYVFEKAFEGLVIDRMEGNEEIFGKLMGDGEFRKLAVEYLLHKVYGALKKTTTDSTVAGG